MTGNRLKLNNNTEALLVGSRRSVSVSQDNHLTVGSHDKKKILLMPCSQSRALH